MISSNGLGAMKVHRGKHHTYLVIDLDYSHKGECWETIYGYLDGILHTFDEAIKKHGEGWVVVQSRVAKKTAAPDNLFTVNEDCKKLPTDAATAFHTVGGDCNSVNLDLYLNFWTLSQARRNQSKKSWK